MHGIEVHKQIMRCRDLLRDIEHVLEDHRRMQNGWRLHYAVDFSEIFGYVLPGRSHEAGMLDDGWSDPMQQFITLSRLFRQGNIVLLDPYASELDAFVRRLLSRSIVESIEHIVDARASIDAALHSAEAAAITGLANELSRRELTADEIDVVINFFEKHATPLVALERGRLHHALKRLQNLVRAGSFRPLREITPEPHAVVNWNAVQARFESFRQKRGTHHERSQFNDALAVEYARDTNRRLLSRKEMLVLITRSPRMQEIVATEAARDGTADFVRHPRIFSALYPPYEAITADFVQQLQVRREALLLFIAAAEEALPHASQLPPATRDGLGMTFAAIQNDWTAGERLASTLEHDSPSEREHLASRLLQFVREREDLVATIEARIEQLSQDLERSLELLTFQFHDHSLQEREEVTGGTILYPVALTSAGLTARINALAEQPAASTGDIIDLLRHLQSEAETEVDSLLTLAVITGAFARWSIALRTTTLAVQKARTPSEIAEAHFFHAVCLRATGSADSTWRDALANLDITAKEQTTPDARQLHERAILLFLLDPDASRNRAIELLETALLTARSPRLQAQIRCTLAELQPPDSPTGGSTQ